jgi:signal transduction histidine kinase
MLSEILFLLLVLAVAALMVVDLVRTRSESPHGQAHGADRAVVAAPSSGSAARAFSPEPARPVPAVAAPVAVLPSREMPPREMPLREMQAPRAFDQMHREMSRSTANEAELREKLNAVFVNLSHRSQSLVQRQLRLIEDLERGEQDARRRAELSKLNRIAMRMHRNSQNLLVVAGQQVSPGWNQPVTLVNLVNAAVAEVEDNERVSAEVQPDIAVRGPAVNDLVHLLVELIENAASFSAAEMPVQITGRILTSGGALIDVTDRGIGMSAKEMAYANQQLDNPPPPDADVPKWMGLLVVARLAARHGIRVRLNQAEFGGLTALVWLPDEILTHHSATADPGRAAEQRGASVSAAAYASARTNAQEAPVARTDVAWSAPSAQARSAQATVPVEPATAVRVSGSARPDMPSADGGVVVPQAESQARMHGLPIFDEVESRWTKGGHEASGPAGLAAASGPASSALPRRQSPATQSSRTVPVTPPGASNRPAAAGRADATGFQLGASQGWAVPAEETNPGRPDES